MLILEGLAVNIIRAQQSGSWRGVIGGSMRDLFLHEAKKKKAAGEAAAFQEDHTFTKRRVYQ